VPGVTGADAEQLGCAWRGSCDERFELLVELGDLQVEFLNTAREWSQRELGGMGGLVKVTEGGAQLATQRGLAADRPTHGKLLA
jgi:hypothetical protein